MSDGVVTRSSSRSVAETVDRLLGLLDQRGLTVFTVVDHSGAAESVGLAMPDTKLVVFGSPAAGTPLMLAEPLSALDLPLKVLVWDDQGTTRVAYNDPGFLIARHHLAEDAAGPLRAIEPLVDLLVDG